jgi:hypothetical protein
MPDSFSQRHGLSGPPPGTLVRDEVPVSFRVFLADLPHAHLGIEFHDMQKVVCEVLQEWPDEQLPPYYDSKRRIKKCEWFRIYEIIEGLYVLLRDKEGPHRGYTGSFVKAISEAFVSRNIGWQLDYNGNVVTRGDESFERIIEVADRELANRQTTRARIQEAIKDLSRRPQPDLTGAISHAFAAMECIVGDILYTPEEIRENTHHTFGSFLKHHPDLFPSEDFKDGFQRLWKYANNEGSRHGKEGIEPARDEAELVVSLAVALVTYLNRKHPK